MKNLHGPARDPSADQKTHNRKTSSRKTSEDTEIDESAAKLFAFTIDANTGQIVKLESLDPSGARHELSDEEKVRLAKEGEGNVTSLEDVLEQAFEAGIACVLGGNGKEEGTQESEEDAQLRHLLLAPLIEHSPAKRFMRREVLDRAILGTLIQHFVSSRPASPEGSAELQ
jgi:hypothetical protein